MADGATIKSTVRRGVDVCPAIASPSRCTQRRQGDNENRCASLPRTGSDDYPPRYTEPIIKEMSTRTFVEGTEVPSTSRMHLCACNMRTVSPHVVAVLSRSPIITNEDTGCT